MKTSKLSLPLALALAAVVTTSPVLAQGNSGKGRGHGKQEQRDNRRDRDRDDDDRFERRRDRDRDDDRFVRRSSVFGRNRFEISRDRRTLLRNGRRVPPGWCIGRGNPHNTPENCGGWRWSQSRSIWDWIGIGDRRDDRRWDDRRDDDRWDDRRWDTRRSGTFSGSHSEFHRWHDRRCRELAAQAGTNLRRLVEVRAICQAEHDDWHRRTGTRH